MAVNKVNFGGKTLIDLTGDTLESAEQLMKGIIAHAKDGSQIEGMLEAGGGGVTSITGTVTITSSWDEFKLFDYEELTSIFGDPLPTLLILFYSNTSKSGQFTTLILWISDQSNARYCYKSVLTGSNAGNASTVSTTLPTLDESGLYLNIYSSYYIKADEYKYCIARFE